MKDKHFLILVVFTLIYLNSCKKDVSSISKLDSLTDNNFTMLSASEESQLSIPFAEINVLNDLATNSDVIHYKIARYYAYMEIENCLYDPLGLLQGNYTITERPVIIYDYDSKPKYYEFGIYDNTEQVIATVTTIAKKEATSLCTFLFNNKMDYSDKGGFDYIVGNYPTCLVGTISSAGNPPTNLHYPNESDIIDAGSSSVVENYQSIINLMDAESQSMSSEGITDIQNIIAESQTGLDEFWDEVDANKNRIIALTDDSIWIDASNYSGKTSSTSWDRYNISEYNNEPMKKMRWSGWCGPSAVAWAYRGQYANYPKTSANYIPVQGDRNVEIGGETYFENYYLRDRRIIKPRAKHIRYDCFESPSDHGLYNRLLAECTGNCDSRFRPMFIAGMNRGMDAVTSSEYKVGYTSEPHNRIRNNNLPIFIMIGFGGSFHWLCGFGSAYERRSGGSIKGKWFLIADNGSATSRHDYYPYWRKQNPDPGLMYKMYK